MDGARLRAGVLADRGVVWRSAPGQHVSGDRWVIAERAAGVLIAVIDGAGHGEEAAEAARIADAVLADDEAATVPELFARCHESLRPTRGAAMTIAMIDAEAQTLTWSGVGDVEGRLVSRAGSARPKVRHAPLRGGVVGLALPPMVPSVVPIRRGDVLMLATDGVSPAFADGGVPRGTAMHAAHAIIDAFGQPHDDALVVVARYAGVPR